ncbi:uncharacterized protein F4812DRAFT_226278 [Daldinia caldariorum]|uniref:uncharacterized protein n=1 Tax=Daldinia caldariorum TaxID=326644 RepID=UPI0020079AD7|nr:uncharacterized protein F4812DRAFT_226278 [Daldinia caldariorum]KAI1463903.1 hypothetical protein F4812DRAFT_226278 [Daldinia caldariorum]
MADNQVDPDFRSIVNAAAATWYSRHSNSPEQAQSDSSDGPPKADPHRPDGNGGPATNNSVIRNSVTAWESALEVLPDELKSVSPPIHPLAQALAEQPALREVEWNAYRQQGGFRPRTAIDYSSLMIYLSGQVNPNPCRNCRLKNGPYARCIVAPPSVLALSSLKHACANCTYQNQHRKCTNLPIDDEELVAKSRMARSSLKLKNPTTMKTPGRRPKSTSNGTPHYTPSLKPDHGHMIRKPSAQSITADAFSDKLRQVRSWSPRSRRRMKAEVMQWQAAIMTIEAEDTQSLPMDRVFEGQKRLKMSNRPTGLPSVSQTPSHPGGSYSGLAAPPSMDESLDEMEAEEYGEVYSQHQAAETDGDENEGESDYEGSPWGGFNEVGHGLKPPL